MNDIGILKAADYMDNGVHLADIGQELVSKALSLGRALYQSGDVYEFDDSRRNLGRVVERSQLLKSLVRYGNYAHVGIDGTEGVVGGLCSGLGQRVKQGTFSYIG